MPCTDPKRCWIQGTTDKGKPKYVFRAPDTYMEHETNYVPCGKCTSCLISKSKEWATRGFHEAQCHTHNTFITLTYDNEHLPENGTLLREDLTQFIKALRYRARPLKFKFLAAGEYGSPENTYRPHYHLCIFGYDPNDKKYLFTNKYGDPVYTSETISKAWKHRGHISVAELNYRTVAYVARYTTKKIAPTNSKKQSEYWIDTETGETNYDPEAYKNFLKTKGKLDEFITMSNGIGKDWHKKFHGDTDKDYVTLGYAKHKIPRYYDKLREKSDPESLQIIKEKRIKAAKTNVKTQSQLDQQNTIANIKLKLKERRL